MKFRAAAIFGLVVTSCTEKATERPEKAEVVEAVTYYLAKHPPLDQRPSCFKPRIMKESKPGIVDEERFTYGHLKANSGSYIKLCAPETDLATYGLYEPAVDGDRATIDVDYSCGRLCGRGMSYKLEKTQRGWHVVDVESRWLA